MLIKNDKIIASLDETGVTDGLVGWWGLNGNLLDKSGNGNNGTWKNTGLNAPVENFVDAIPDGGKGLSFNGTSDYINCGNKEILDVFRASGSKLLSISVWVKTDVLNSQRNILCKGKAGEGYYFRMEQTGLLRFTTLGVRDYTSTLARIVDTNFHHLTVVFDAMYAVSFYMDGLFIEKSPAASISGKTSNEPFLIGIDFSLAYKWDGIIDDVRIYNRALTDKEISRLYRSFKQ